MDPIWLNDQNITATRMTNINESTENPYLDRLEALDLPMQTFLVCLYSMTSFLAFVGNFIVIIVEIFGKRSAMNLRKFLINLAISDILVGVFSVPFTYTDFMLGRWIFPFWLCPVAQFVQILSAFVTAFTLTVIGIERYFAILCPHSNKNQWFTGRSIIVLSLGWLFASLFGLIAMIHTTTVPFKWDNNTYYDCRGAEMEELESKIYNTAVFIFTFALPLIIQTFSYGSIGRRIMRQQLINNKLPLRKNIFDKSRAKITRMLIAIVILFGICWFPIRIFMLLLVYYPQILEINDIFSYYTYIGSFFFCHWLAMANSFVNPIIYSFLSKSFRADLKDVIKIVSHYFHSPKEQMNTEKTSTRI